MGGLCAAALGCDIGRAQPAPIDDLAKWSRAPLPPDPALAALAAAGSSSCSGMSDAGPITLLLQDRRTAVTAAFLVAGPDLFGECLVSSGGGGSSGGFGPALGRMTAAISIDAQGSGSIGNREANLLGGRVAGAPIVTVELRDGSSMTASFAAPYWLVWWSSDVEARQVVAHDVSGALIATLEVPTIHPAGK
jgi:hypothetical protein